MTELFEYSLLSSALGIIIVFIALILLSVLMVALKRVFDMKKKAPVAETHPVPGAAAGEVDDELDWLTAAVSAYLYAEEDEFSAPSADSWVPDGGEKTDPWRSGVVLRKQV